jgi:hypothetical protein
MTNNLNLSSVINIFSRKAMQAGTNYSIFATSKTLNSA